MSTLTETGIAQTLDVPPTAPLASAPAREEVPVLGAAGALVRANVRYWSRIAPLVRRELRRWRIRATTIPNRSVRELAMDKLRAEHFNAEVAATLATLSPAPERVRTVEAIVALEVLYDYLDGLTERLCEDVLAHGDRLYRPFATVFGPAPERGDCNDARRGPRALADGGYAEELAATVRAAVARLPSHVAVAAAASRAACRCAEAQVRAHAIAGIGVDELEGWARERAPAEGFEWRAYVAGSVASVLSVHALVAAAAEPSCSEAEAEAIDRAYLSVSALSTMLDSLVDYELDVRVGQPWLVHLYGGAASLGGHVGEVASRAIKLVQRLPHRAHHTMTLLGVVAYYTSAPEAKSKLARPPVRSLHRELPPVIVPTLAVMRGWRLAKRLRSRFAAARHAAGARGSGG